MTEKQRWLLRDLDSWRDRQLQKIGKYGPKRAISAPANVRAARRTVKRAEQTIRQWEEAKKAPWEKQRAGITKRCEFVRRVILFEKTEIALKAIRALK